MYERFSGQDDVDEEEALEPLPPEVERGLAEQGISPSARHLKDDPLRPLPPDVERAVAEQGISPSSRQLQDDPLRPLPPELERGVAEQGISPSPRGMNPTESSRRSVVDERTDEMTANAAGAAPDPLQSPREIREELELFGGDKTEMPDQGQEKAPGQQSLRSRAKKTARSAGKPFAAVGSALRQSKIASMAPGFALGVLTVLVVQAGLRRRRQKRRMTLREQPREWLSQSSRELQTRAGRLASEARVAAARRLRQDATFNTDQGRQVGLLSRRRLRP